MLSLCVKCTPKSSSSQDLTTAQDTVKTLTHTNYPHNNHVVWLFHSYGEIKNESFTLSVLWKKLIKQRGGADTSPLFSVLAKVSDGYTSGRIVQAIKSVVTKRRIQQQASKPLTASEFIPILAQMDPVFKEEEEALKVSWIHSI